MESSSFRSCGMDERDSRRKRRVFDWPEEATQLVRNYVASAKMGQGHGRNALATLATRLVQLSGNPRDACFRFLRQRGVTQKRAWRPWTKPEQQRLFDLIESVSDRRSFQDHATLNILHSCHAASPGRKRAKRSRLVHNLQPGGSLAYTQR